MDSELAANAMLWIVALVAIMVLSILTVRQYHYIQRLRTNQKLLE